MNDAPVTTLKPPAGQRFWRWLAGRGILGWTLLAVVIWAGIIGMFYLVEDWRGWHAWSLYKREAKAHGEALDWGSYTPAAVPVEQNFFAAPNMQKWFTGRGGTTLSGKFSWSSFHSFLGDRRNNVVAEVIVVPTHTRVPPNEADMVLEYNKYSYLSIATEDLPPASEPSNILAAVTIDSVPLTDAIKNLARQAKVNYIMDPSVMAGWKNAQEPYVTLKWTNVTADDALAALLKNYGLALIPTSNREVARIIRSNPAESTVHAAYLVREMIGQLLTNAVESTASGPESSQADAALGFKLVATPLSPIKTLRVVVRSDSVLPADDIKKFFPAVINFPKPILATCVAVTPAETNSFHVSLGFDPYVNAADYLAWTDQFQPDFDAVEAALKRPYARMEGDYEQPEAMPIPNFLTVRVLAQALSQRAQCHMLTRDPEKALRDLMLVRDLCRLLEARPSGKPMTVIAAMINAAVSSLYVGTFADGVRLGTWREPELAAIQRQLTQVDLEPYLYEALRFESAAQARILEAGTPAEMTNLLISNAGMTSWDKLKNPTRLFLMFAPRGWVCQSFARAGESQEAMLNGFDLTKGVVLPDKVDAAAEKFQAEVKHVSPYNYLMPQLTPNYSHAVMIVARNQTLVNQAIIVCALERYRLANRQYPETLAALSPRFIDKLPKDIIGGQPLKYRVENGKFVLYSVGWNQKDDGGIAAFASDYSGDALKNDWVWP